MNITAWNYYGDNAGGGGMTLAVPSERGAQFSSVQEIRMMLSRARTAAWFAILTAMVASTACTPKVDAEPLEVDGGNDDDGTGSKKDASSKNSDGDIDTDPDTDSDDAGTHNSGDAGNRSDAARDTGSATDARTDGNANLGSQCGQTAVCSVSQANGQCEGNPASGKSPGEGCVYPTDCQAFCCNCSASLKSWTGRVCDNGRCADLLTTCARTRADSMFCN